MEGPSAQVASKREKKEGARGCLAVDSGDSVLTAGGDAGVWIGMVEAQVGEPQTVQPGRSCNEEVAYVKRCGSRLVKREVLSCSLENLGNSAALRHQYCILGEGNEKLARPSHEAGVPETAWRAIKGRAR